MVLFANRETHRSRSRRPGDSRLYLVVPSRASPSSVTCAPDMPVESTNLKCNARNAEDGLRDWVQLKGTWFPRGCGVAFAYANFILNGLDG